MVRGTAVNRLYSDFGMEVRVLPWVLIVPWCSGSTTGSEPVSESSNLLGTV